MKGLVCEGNVRAEVTKVKGVKDRSVQPWRPCLRTLALPVMEMGVSEVFSTKM